jgi:hypothetical protein
VTPPQQAAALARDLSDVVTDVSRRAARRARDHFLFILDTDDPTALELLTTYAPAELQLAYGASDDAAVIALTLADGLRLLRAPGHEPTIFRRVADEIAADTSNAVPGLCIARGGFVRFQVEREKELN